MEGRVEAGAEVAGWGEPSSAPGTTPRLFPPLLRRLRCQRMLERCGYVVCDEESLRLANAWHHAHRFKIRGIVLLIGGRLIFPATSEGFFRNSGTSDVERPAKSIGAPASANIDQEATPADDTVAKDDWLARRMVVAPILKGPRRRSFVAGPRDDAPPVSVSSIDLPRCRKTDLENADVISITEIWSGAPSGKRALAYLWLGETMIDKLHCAPKGYEFIGDRTARAQKGLRGRVTSGRACGG